MSIEITVPSIGESINSGTLAAWLKRDGESVREGDALFELETEKSTLEFPAPGSGVLHIDAEAGSEVSVGQCIGGLEETAEAAAPAPKPDTSKAAPEAPASAPPAASALRAATDPPMSPAARRLVNEEGLEPAAISGSGKGGRITKADAEAALEARADAPAPQSAAPAPRPPVAVSQTQAPTQPPARTDGRPRQRIPMSLIRKRTAQRLVEAKQRTAHTTTFNEIDMHSVMQLRSTYRDDFEKAYGIRLGFMSFFVKACCLALKQYPQLNSMIDGDDLIQHEFYDIGIAISLETGLLVPVIRNADQLGFAAIEAGIADLATRAKAKKLLPDELIGGTFTITNGGVFGSMLSTPIPAYPQAAILGMHAIQKRPVVIDDQIVIRPVMYVALTYDHRIIDGREAIGFLVKIKALIEAPERLMLEV